MMNKSKIAFTMTILLSIIIIPSTFGMENIEAENKMLKYPTFSLTTDSLKVQFKTGDNVPIPFLKRGATIKDIKNQVAEEWNKKHHTTWTSEDIVLAGPGNLVGGSPDVKMYEDVDVISKDELMKGDKRVMKATTKPKEENNHVTEK